MPRDEWKRDRDRQLQRKARHEFAEFGKLRSYETSFEAGDERTQSIGEPCSAIEMLGEIRKKLPLQIRAEVPEFGCDEAENERIALKLLKYVLESGTEVNVAWLAFVVEQIGASAIKELRLLLSSGTHGTIIRALKLLQQTDTCLARAAEEEIRAVSKFRHPEVRREGKKTLSRIASSGRSLG